MVVWQRKPLSDETTFHLDDKATVTTLASAVVKIITKSTRMEKAPHI
jgi:hypothetical protein